VWRRHEARRGDDALRALDDGLRPWAILIGNYEDQPSLIALLTDPRVRDVPALIIDAPESWPPSLARQNLVIERGDALSVITKFAATHANPATQTRGLDK
jgi:hypothetical protein